MVGSISRTMPKVRGFVLLLVVGLAARVVAQDNFAAEDVASAMPKEPVFFFEPFRGDWKKEWINSEDSKYDGVWMSNDYSEIPGDAGAQMSSAGRLHAMAKTIEGGIDFSKNKPLVIQYEIKAPNGLACDGQYMKLLHEVKGGLSKFDNTARYTIMFGPDKCAGTDKVHFIIQYQNPISKEWEEKHAEEMPYVAGGDRNTHLYTLIVRPDHSYEVLVDLESKKKGTLLEGFEPPINPSEEIDDPTDSKPKDWVDEVTVDDPDAKKPDDWDEDAPELIDDMNAQKPAGWLDDEPKIIPDPNAHKPADWDDEEDGDWEAPTVANPKCTVGCGAWKRPQISNPDYKGKWHPLKIPNPAYKGVWAPRKIKNKNYFAEKEPFSKLHTISAVSFELLTVSGGIVFDNVLICDSETTAYDFAKRTWEVRHKLEVAKAKSASGGMFGSIETTFNNVVMYLTELYEHQPVAFLIGAGLSVLLFMLWMVTCCCAGKKKPVDNKKTDAIMEDDDEDDDDSEDDVVEKKKKPAPVPAEDDNEEISPAAASGKPKKRISRKD